jgi:TrmH family RNA methyltransferase
MAEPFPSKLKKYSKKLSYTYAIGTEPVIALLTKLPEKAIKVFLKSSGLDRPDVAKITELCKKNGIPHEYSDRDIDRIFPKENTFAVAAFKTYEQELNPDLSHVTLVEPRNTGNIGTIMRTMAAFGIMDLAVIRPAVNIFDPKIVRSTMGTFFQMRFQYFDSFKEYMSRYNRKNYLFMPQAKDPFNKVEYTEPYTLVFGNESTGLPVEYLEYGTPVVIPQTNNIDSVNLSIAAGIAIYEATKAKFN